MQRGTHQRGRVMAIVAIVLGAAGPGEAAMVRLAETDAGEGVPMVGRTT